MASTNQAHSPVRRLFCWSGGGLPGLDLHAGIWRALSERGIESSHNCGCSAGAIMAALNSAGHDPDYIAGLIRSLSDNDVRRERFGWKARALWIDWFLDSAPILALLERLLPETFLFLTKPLTVAATRVRDGHLTLFNAGLVPLRDAVLASMSIAGVFPHVNVHGEDYADGGPRANLPLPADWRSYHELYLLIAARPVKYVKRRGILAQLLRNVDWMAMAQIEDVVKLAEGAHKALRGPKVTVIWPLLDQAAGSLRFRHEFIDQAYEQTGDILKLWGRV